MDSRDIAIEQLTGGTAPVVMVTPNEFNYLCSVDAVMIVAKLGRSDILERLVLYHQKLGRDSAKDAGPTDG